MVHKKHHVLILFKTYLFSIYFEPVPSFLPDTMAVEKRLAYSIVQFLRDQTHCGSLNSDEQESLEGRSALCIKQLKSQAFFYCWTDCLDCSYCLLRRKNSCLFNNNIVFRHNL